MGKLDCQKKLAELDEMREIVQFWIMDLVLSSRNLAASLKGAFLKMNDVAALNDLEKQLKEFMRFSDPDEAASFIDSWESDAKKFRKEVLDAVLDKVEREKNKGELATACVPVKDYAEASESEIKEARQIVANAKGLFQIADSFAKWLKQRALAPMP